MNKIVRYTLYIFASAVVTAGVVALGILFMNVDKPKADDGDYFTTEAPLFSYGLLNVRDAGNQLWGYINKNGEYAIAPQFRSAEAFNKNAVAVVSGNDLLYGVIRPDGSFILPIECDYVNLFMSPEDDIILFEKFGKYGLANIDGTVLKESFFDSWSYFNKYGYAVMRYDGKYGIIDKSGEFTVEPLYDSLDLSIDGMYAYYNIKGDDGTWETGEYGTLDMLGNKIETSPNDTHIIYEGDIFNIVQIYDGEIEYKSCITDKDGNTIIEEENGWIFYDEVCDFFEVSAGESRYLLDREYRRMTESFSIIEYCAGSPYYLFRDNEMAWGYGELYKGVVIPARFEWAEPFDENGKYAVVGEYVCYDNALKGRVESFLIDINGSVVLPNSYASLHHLCGELYAFSEKDALGVMTAQGEKLTKEQYSSIEYDENSGLIRCIGIASGDAEIMNSDGEIFMTLYGQSTFYCDGQYVGVGIVRGEDGKRYYADTEGNAVTGAYDYIKKQFNGYFYFEDNGYCGFIDKNERVIFKEPITRRVSDSRNYLGLSGDGYFFIMSGAYCSLYDLKGNRIGKTPFMQIGRQTFSDCVNKGYTSNMIYD